MRGKDDVVGEPTLANQENNPKSRVSLNIIMCNGFVTEDNVLAETETHGERLSDIKVDFKALG